MSVAGDFLDSLLTEWFGASDHLRPQTSVPSTAPSCEFSFADSVLDFDLSLLQPSSASSPTSSVDPVLLMPRRDSLQVLVSEIEDRLGIFYVSVRGVRSSQVIELVTLYCQQLFDPSVFLVSFSIVRVLDLRSPGVFLPSVCLG